MMEKDTESRLIGETGKWKKRLEDLTITPLTGKGQEYKTNIDAYISDSAHFMEKKDYVRAFEAIVWAWAWAEIGKDLKLLDY